MTTEVIHFGYRTKGEVDNLPDVKRACEKSTGQTTETWAEVTCPECVKTLNPKQSKS